MLTINLSLTVILTGMLIAQGFLAAGLLGFSRTNQPANRFLALLLLTMALWLVDSFYKAAGIYEQDPDFYFQPLYYSFAFGPFIYFYVKSLTTEDFRFTGKSWLHFIPVLVQISVYGFLFFQDYAFKRWFWLEVHRPITLQVEFDGTLLSLFIYLLLSLRLLRKYNRWLENNFSELSRINLYWLRILLSLLLLLTVLWGIDVVLRDVFDIYRGHNLSEVSLGIMVLVLAIGGLRQSTVAQIEPGDKELPAVEEFQLDQQLIQQIRKRMTEHKDYLNPTLSLKEFALSLGIPSRTLSNHINTGLGVSFVDFVNEFRVHAVKAKIDAGYLEQYTLLALAFESGFNSKSTFNRVFKKMTGMSPSRYVDTSQNTF
jgi:AraC-like DNA-binding protein